MNNRMVTYSKRKNGLFKKLSELCTLCGAEGAVFVMSPAGKPYSFGHPSVEVIRNRFLNGGNPPSQANPPTLSIIRLNFKLESVNNELDGERERGDGLITARTAMRPEENRMLAEVDNLGSEELRQLESLLIMMKNNLSNHHSRLEQAHSGQNPIQDLSFSLNPALPTENQTVNSGFGHQYNINNNSNNPIHFNAPVTIGHQYNIPPMMMIPAPQGFVNNPSLGMRPTHAGNFASSSVMHNFMDAGFPNPNMGHPFQGNSAQVPIQGQFDENPNQVPFQGQFDGNQNMPANIGMNNVTGTYQSFTDMLMELDSDVPEITTNPPSNP